ncbi:MAG TPA: hypothetical protein VHQ43_04510 [Solirubrobacterales bacterium]|nr:hypothetical protein [Solirubrobacterales bacterium]
MIGAGRKLGAALVAAVLGVALLANSAQAEFGIASFDMQIAAKAAADPNRVIASPEGGQFSQAGGHPYSVITHIEWNNHPDTSTDPEFAGVPTPDADLKDTLVDLPPGFVGNPNALASCTSAELLRGGVFFQDPTECPPDSAVGIVQLRTTFAPFPNVPLFNMTPAPGSPARFGFKFAGSVVYFDTALRSGDYGIVVGPRSAAQALRITASNVTFWGQPADPRHDEQRCNPKFEMADDPLTASCQGEVGESTGPHASNVAKLPFLTMPSACTPAGRGQKWTVRSDSWQDPGNYATASLFTHEAPYAPEEGAPGEEVGTTGCSKVPFEPNFSAQATQKSAASSSGLEVGLKFPTDGLLNPDGIAQSALKKAVVTLPEGMTINPSQAEGLGVCGPSEYASASIESFGCPDTAKIGSVEVKTPLLKETIPGNVYVAKPDDPETRTKGAENPFDSLIAIYIVLREPQRGISVKIPGKVAPDPKTGQITASFDDLPQLPFESFAFKFREGPRAPLITPSTCGQFKTEADFYPWARPNEAVHTNSEFEIDQGPNNGPCPSGGVPPFHPGFSAGALNNNAGTFSPFLMRLTRSDGEQDMTKFSAVLPKGLSAKIAGVAWCPESAIELAREKTGTEEQEEQSCPANSQIGTIMAGAGVGSTLIYVPGRLYLSGPFNGAPLSVVAVVPAVAGPFDVGTVVTHVALGHDHRTARVDVEGDRSDPLPHILAGIPLNVRDIQVNVDRPGFTLNPTSCDPTQIQAAIFGSNLDFFSSADDISVPLASRFQIANCSGLDFKPKLALSLSGGTKRGQFPAFKAILTPRPGDANLNATAVRLPHSSFLEQGHIRTICTRVQFAAKACPAGSIYGHVKAWTPLLDEPLEGPVYLRSSDHKLPDMVLALNGVLDIEAVGRVDSVKGEIRASFEDLPDAPVTKVLLTMQGAKKGLIVNSRNLCGQTPKAKVKAQGHNGKPYDFAPPMKTACNGKAKRRTNSKHH